MNLLSMKRAQLVEQLTKLAVAKDAEIAQKVAAYRETLEAQKNEEMSKLRVSIDAIDVLLSNVPNDFEYEIVDDEDTCIEESLQDEDEDECEPQHIVEVQEAEAHGLADCFRKKTLIEQRPGMNAISTPSRH